jgi:hypothetical protein
MRRIPFLLNFLPSGVFNHLRIEMVEDEKFQSRFLVLIRSFVSGLDLMIPCHFLGPLLASTSLDYPAACYSCRNILAWNQMIKI